MWQNIILIFIIAACMFFIGRRIRRQLNGSKTGCGCSCSGGCNSGAAQTPKCDKPPPISKSATMPDRHASPQ